MSPKVRTTLLVLCCCFLKIAVSERDEDPPKKQGHMDNNTSDAIADELLQLTDNLYVQPGMGKERLLILGATGTGRSLVSSVLSNDPTLEAHLNGWKITITDKEGRVSTEPVTESKTIAPRRLVDAEGHEYFDCPGFEDTRGLAHDISASYLIKQLVSSTNRLKLAFVVDYSSIAPIGSRDALLVLARHVTTMFRNLEEYSKSVMLIVNKVPNIKINGSRVADQEFVDMLVGELGRIKEAKIEQNKATENRNTINRNLKLIKFIDAVSGNNGSRIGIVHLIEETGFVNQMPAVVGNRLRLRRIINEKLEFFPNDFKNINHTISNESKELLRKLREDIKKNLKEAVAEVAQHLRRLYLENYSGDLSQSLETFRGLYNVSKQVDDINYPSDKMTPQKFVRKLRSVFKEYEVIKAPAIMSKNVMSDQIFSIMRDVMIDLDIRELFNDISRFWVENIQFLKLAERWYQFLKVLDHALADRTEDIAIDQLTRECDIITEEGYWAVEKNLRQLQPFLNSISQYGLYETIRDSNVTRNQVKMLKRMLEAHRVNQLDIECDENKTMTVKGSKVTMSAVVENKCWQDAVNVDIFASNMFIVDKSFVKSTENCLLSIFSPHWLIKSKHVFYLNGTNGRSAYPAKADKGRPGIDGTDGIAGCHVSFIAGTTRNAALLTIDVTGGIGGAGQEGSDGADGEDGEDPVVPGGEKYIEEYWRRLGFPFTLIKKQGDTYMYAVTGKAGRPGLDGADGGRAGFHSINGYASIIVTNENASTTGFNIIHREKFSMAGLPGLGGKGGRNGKRFLVDTVDTSSLFSTSFSHKIKSEHALGYERNGKKGRRFSDKRDSDVLSNNKVIKPYRALQKFKTFIHSELANHHEQLKLQKFLMDINNNPQINSNLTLIDLVNEFDYMERQFSILQKVLPFKTFLDSFIRRIEIFNDTNSMTSDERELLHMLYTGVLSKINALNVKIPTVVNVELFLSLLVDTINRTHSFYPSQLRSESETYHNALNRSIFWVLNIIEERIAAEMGDIFNSVQDQMMDEVKLVIKQKEQLLAERIQEKKILDNIFQQRIFTSLDIAVGTVTVITRLAAFASNMIATDFHRFQQSARFEIENLDTVYANISKNYHKRYINLKNKLIDTSEELKKFKHESLDSINETFSEVKSKIDEIIGRGELPPSNQLRKLEELCSSILNERIKQEQKKPTLKRKLITFLTKSKKLFDLGEIGMKKYQEIASNQTILSELHGAVLKSQDRLDALHDKEDDLVDNIMPMLNETRKLLQQLIVDLSRDKKRIDINFSNWKVKIALKDLQYAFGDTFDKTQSQKIIRILDALKECIFFDLEIFDRLKISRDQKRFADYMAGLKSDSAYNNIGNNSQLQDSLIKMKEAILKNLILGNYNLALKLFILHNFPFGSYNVETFDLRSNRDLNEYKSQAISNVNTMTHGPLDKEVRQDLIRSGKNSPVQLFLWDHTTFNTTEVISKLFRGQRITLNADVKKSRRNAVKFKKIELNFKIPSNQSREKELQLILQDFYINMKMGVNNYYRCNDDIYYFPNEQEIHLSYQMRGASNNVYNKICNSPSFIFSPYTNWEISLETIHSSKNRKWVQLRSFEEDIIDIELRGTEEYLIKNSMASRKYCQLDLKNFYKRADYL